MLQTRNMANLLNIHISLFGVIPKKGRPNRLIQDLSSPENHSVNDGIPKTWCSLHYLSVLDVVEQLGHGVLLGKMDIR